MWWQDASTEPAHVLLLAELLTGSETLHRPRIRRLGPPDALDAAGVHGPVLRERLETIRIDAELVLTADQDEPRSSKPPLRARSSCCSFAFTPTTSIRRRAGRLTRLQAAAHRRPLPRRTGRRSPPPIRTNWRRGRAPAAAGRQRHALQAPPHGDTASPRRWACRNEARDYGVVAAGSQLGVGSQLPGRNCSVATAACNCGAGTVGSQLGDRNCGIAIADSRLRGRDCGDATGGYNKPLI